MTDAIPSDHPTPTASDLGLVWAIHAPELDKFPWQLALADNRVALVSADSEQFVVLAGYSEPPAPDHPTVPFPLIPPRVLAAARDAIRQADRDEVAELLARRRQIAQVWGVPDVVAVRPDLTDAQAWTVLKEVDRTQDADAGITWRRLEEAAADLFGPAPGAVVDDD